MRTSIERMILPAVVVGCVLARAAAGGPVALDADRVGPLLHSNQDHSVPPDQDALALPGQALPWAAEVAAGWSPGTCDLLIRGSGAMREAPGGARLLDAADFRFDNAGINFAPPGLPASLGGIVPAPPALWALGLVLVLAGRRRG